MNNRKYMSDVPIEIQGWFFDKDCSSEELIHKIEESFGLTNQQALSKCMEIRKEIWRLNPELVPEGEKKLKKGCLIGVLVLFILVVIGALIPNEDKKSSSSSSTPSIVKNLPWDNSVIPVKNYIKNNLKDPSSLEFIRWGNVIKTANGTYVVNVKYRAKNSFGGYVVNDQIFTLNSSGQILKINDY